MINSTKRFSSLLTRIFQQYDWGTGKVKWEDYHIAHGEENPEIPQDWPDQQLIKWVKQTRRGKHFIIIIIILYGYVLFLAVRLFKRVPLFSHFYIFCMDTTTKRIFAPPSRLHHDTREDYWRYQNGETTVTQQEKGRFGMLGMCGFDFGNPDGSKEEDEEPHKTEKPSAQPTKNMPATESRSNNALASPTPTVSSAEAVDSSSKAAAAASHEPAKNLATEGRSRNASTTPTIASSAKAADSSTSKAAAADCAGQKSSSGAVEVASSTKRKRGHEDDTGTDEDEQEETSIQAEEEEEEGDSKPSARPSRRKTKKTKSNASPSASLPAPKRYPKRARTAPQSSVSSKALAASTGKRKAPAASSKKQAKRKKTKQYKPLELLRVIPKEQEGEVRQQIRKECAKLLESKEPLTADKAKLVSSQLAESNVSIVARTLWRAWLEREGLLILTFSKLTFYFSVITLTPY